MPDYYFHYTSLVAAQMVVSSGQLLPGRGFIYLSDELYASGAKAAQLLGIPPSGPAVTTGLGVAQLTKAVDLVCCIPAGRLGPAYLQGPESADDFRDHATLAVIYSGGGRQYKYSRPISVVGLTWVAMVRP